MKETDYTEIIGVTTNSIPAQNPRKSKDSKAEIQYQENSLLQRATHYRDFEISASWSRAKYFTLFLSALFVAYYTMKSSDYTSQTPCYQWLTILITGLGTIISWIWYWVNRGSKIIYENWEHHIDFIEKACHIGNISRVHCYKSFNKSNLLGTYPISPSKANILVSLLISVAFSVLFAYEINLFEFVYSIVLEIISLLVSNPSSNFILLLVPNVVLKCTLFLVYNIGLKIILLSICCIVLIIIPFFVLPELLKSRSYCNSYDEDEETKIYLHNRLSKDEFQAVYHPKNDEPEFTKP